MFDILSNYELEEILINDINKELTNTYSQIKNNLAHLVEELSKMQELFWEMDTEECKIYYYEKRERFNYLKVNVMKKLTLKKQHYLFSLIKLTIMVCLELIKKDFSMFQWERIKCPLSVIKIT